MTKIKKIISVFVLVLYCAYYASGVLFFHAHKLDCGTVISHSHFYGGDAHSHSENALQLIDHLTNSLLFGGGLFFSFILFLFSKGLLFSCHKREIFHFQIGGNSLRAPPVLQISNY
jgi:hypothetical protein